uniref:Uncharacterized protein n=1 Tax=Brassica oleracea var. oleracea TaxID=109376 RepID=A0A0D3CY21_BRAOL
MSPLISPTTTPKASQLRKRVLSSTGTSPLGKKEIYKWPSDDTLKSHGMKVREPRIKKHSRATLALAASSDGRYLATGGVDHHVHIWDVLTREHVQAFPGHRNTAWNVEDKAFVQDSFGHQYYVLAIDAQRKERANSVGRDRTMQLHKSCCFISDTEYRSGSDNMTVALWGMLKKKPIFLLKNEHSVAADGITINENGDHDKVEYNNSCTASSWVSSVAVCRGSDLSASGAGNGFVHLMAVKASALRPLFKLPLVRLPDLHLKRLRVLLTKAPIRVLLSLSLSLSLHQNNTITVCYHDHHYY